MLQCCAHCDVTIVIQRSHPLIAALQAVLAAMRLPRTTSRIRGFAQQRRCVDCTARKHRVCTLPGDGIGPEIMRVATDLLAAAGAREDVQFELAEHLIGGAAIDAAAVPYPEATQAACKSSDAVLLAAIGG